MREVEIWKALRHPNVLELYGASSTSGKYVCQTFIPQNLLQCYLGDPPWFFVSPYVKHGSLSEYLRKQPADVVRAVEASEARYRTASLPPSRGGAPGGGGAGTSLVALATSNSASSASSLVGSPTTSTNHHSSPSASSLPRPQSSSTLPLPSPEPIKKEWDLLRFMCEIARGMDYLHSQGVLHGDLKASNVLVDDRVHCLITDFGQSEMRSEAYRISGTQEPRESSFLVVS